MKEKPTRIHKFNLFYFFLKLYEKFAFHSFYHKIEITGRENIPYGNPIIFTPNHQNALMDALAVLNTCRLNPVFMARADIFKKKSQAKILSFLKILPIYRMRDGAEELSKNTEIFDKASIILSDTHSICLMPEGNHGHQRRLRPLVKGSFRIAFNAQEKLGSKKNVKIVPVGLDYEHYQKINQDLLINYGPPIEVKDYMDLFHENQPRAINLLKDRLAEELKKVMIHVENEERHDTYHELRFIYNKRMRNRLGIIKNSHYNCFIADKEMIRILDENFLHHEEEMKILSDQVFEFSEGVKKSDFRYWIFDRKRIPIMKALLQIVFLVISFPVFLFGWLNNYIPYTIPQRKIRNVKDPQFHSSFKFVLALILFPVYYTIAAVLIRIISGNSWLPWLYIISGLAAGYFSLYYASCFKKLRAVLRYKKLIRKAEPAILHLKELHERIISTMNKMVEEYQQRYIPENKVTRDVREGIL